MLGIAGPDLLPLPPACSSLGGRVGPTTSSSLLSSSRRASCCLDDVYSGEPRRSWLPVSCRDCSAAGDRKAFCSVLGSYQPSASSPRFLTDVSLTIPRITSEQTVLKVRTLPLPNETLPSPLHLSRLQIFKHELLLDVEV